MNTIVLRGEILKLLLNANREMRPKEIEEELRPIVKNKARTKREKLLSDDTFHVHVIRTLRRLKDEGVIQRKEISRKNVLYSIKNETHARLISTAYDMGWDLSRKRVSLELSIDISGKTYEELVQKISKAISDIVLLRKAFPYSHTRFPRPIIFDFSIPISQEKDNILKNKILIMAPDERSVAKRSFTQEQFKDLMLYLTQAWMLYFEEKRITHNDIVITHFTKEQAERLRRIVELGKAKSVDDVVHLATLKYLNFDTYSIDTGGPVVKMAIEKGIYKNKGEFIEAAVAEHRKRLAEKLAEELR